MPISREDFFKIGENEMYLHKSMVQMYIRCPLQFRRSIIDKIPRTPSIEQALGTEFHEWAKDFFKAIDLDHLMQYNEVKDVVTYFETHMNALHADVFVWEKTFCLIEAKRYIELRKLKLERLFKPVFTEQTFRSDILRLETTPDRMDWYDTKNYIIVEYKTSNSMHYTDLRRELAIQAMLISEKYPECRFIGVINPKLNVVWAERLKDITLNAAKKQIMKLREAIRTNTFPSKPGDMCMWCDYSGLCMDEGIFNSVDDVLDSDEDDTTTNLRV